MATPCPHLPIGTEIGWQSAGGPAKHPARMLGTTLTIDLPPGMSRVHLVGIFGLWSAPTVEPPGSQGATLGWLRGESTIRTVALVAGRHYDDAAKSVKIQRSNGDGTSIETLGATEVDGRCYRVDILTIDVPQGADRLSFHDTGTVASFVIFDALAEVEKPTACPFREASGGVSLAEVGAIIRLADQKRFQQALAQLSSGIRQLSDLDEGRSLALTFLAVIVAALLELGGSRDLHRLQLEAAREFDRLQSTHDIADRVSNLLLAVTHPHFVREKSHTDNLIEDAIRYVGRHFARDISDEEMARNLGLSTSHFRYLFKQATGIPFHKYVIASRLEMARQMLLESEMSISEVAGSVGFASPAHFTRAFNQRFGSSPKVLRSARSMA